MKHSLNLVAMVPARLGSQRLKQKNLQTIQGLTLTEIALRKCVLSGVFDRVFLNTEAASLQPLAHQERCSFFHRKEELADHRSTSESFVADFLEAISCDYVFQVHTIAPLLSLEDLQKFVDRVVNQRPDTALCCTLERIECAFQGHPINFSQEEKSNSQALVPVQRIPWSITAWRREAFLRTKKEKKTATYNGTVAYVDIDALSGWMIKTQFDLEVARHLWPFRFPEGLPALSGG
jgi:CMP-N-acetylneuraminic acid synthetase